MRTVRGVTQVIYYTWSILFQYCTSKLWCSLSHVWLFEAPGTAVQQALLSMEFSSQEYWCRLSFPPLGDLAEPGIEPTSPASLALAGRIFTTELPGMLFQTLYVLMLCYAKSLQSCLTLCDPIDGSPPGSAVPGILQVRILAWVAISFSNAWKRKVKVKVKSCPTLSDTMDCSLPGSSIHGIFQARVLEWGAIAFSIICP